MDREHQRSKLQLGAIAVSPVHGRFWAPCVQGRAKLEKAGAGETPSSRFGAKLADVEVGCRIMLCGRERT